MATSKIQAPDLGHPAQREPEGFDFILTHAERSRVASFKVALEANRRRQNELDRMQANAETAGLLARVQESAA